MKIVLSVVFSIFSWGFCGATMERHTLIQQPAYWALYGAFFGMALVAALAIEFSEGR